MKDICIYHGNCADGFGAACAVRNHFQNDEFEFYAGVYQKAPPDCSGRRVLMVDFSYKRAVIEDLAQSAKSVLILDHHKSAAEDLAGLPTPNDAFGNPTDDISEWIPEKGLYALFDMERSGAGIAWDYFYGKYRRPRLIDHIEDRDLWRFSLPKTREIQAALFSYPYDFDLWLAMILDPSSPERLAQDGAAIERKHHKDVAELLSVCERPMVIAGFTVPVASLPYTLVSDAAHLMAKGSPFAACYWDTPESRIFGLRSTDDGIDVSEIAKQYGGGGHAHAAGFSVPRSHELAQQ